jgi:hypothetical protein
MRSRIAAACAALLVGLAPPGAVAGARLLEAAAWAPAFASAQGLSRARTAGHPALREAQASQSPPAPLAFVPFDPAAPEPAARSCWRAPSGPAPSQAPPLA